MKNAQEDTQRKTTMLDPHLMRDLSLDRQRAMIEWREQQRLMNRMPQQEPALKGLVKAVIHKLEAIGHLPQPEAQPRAEQRRREA
jgi:hypothetical protein